MFKSPLFLYFLFILFARFTWGAQTSCSELSKDLQSMGKAQEQIILSMQDGQSLAAKALNDAYMKAALNQGQLDKEYLAELKRRSKAINDRNQKSKNLTNKFNKASREMFKELAACLK
ncbi:MAG: hypothetical protein KDD45_03195 [Bdellovibrionales bacterium]|nr:hypothetical protein [Bdellovibrionales bacterium]